jgi:formylglycine-generating enzyme required for sulfatase activity
MQKFYEKLFFFVFALLAAAFFGRMTAAEGRPPGSGAGSPSNLAAPANITADAGRERVTLTWSPGTGANSYNIYYGTKPGVTKTNFIKRIENQHSPYVERELKNGIRYYFRVAGSDGKDEGPLSREVTAMPSATPPPPAPTDVSASPGAGWVHLRWSNSIDAISYNIYYGKAPQVTTTSIFKDTNVRSPRYVAPLVEGIPYFFVVTALNASGESHVSFETSAVPVANVPAVPKGVTAKEGNGQVTLTWIPAPGADSYNLYYATEITVSKQTGVKVANVSGDRRVIAGLANNRPYYFVVTAVNASGESGESTFAVATPLAEKPVPTLVRIPAGSFQMGDNLDGTAYALPVRTVLVDDFYIDRYETMYDLWKEVYEWAVAHGYGFDNAGRNGSFSLGTNLPVTTVSWYDVVKWLNARSEKEGRTPVYYTDATRSVVYRKGRVNLPDGAVRWEANGYRLPTEAEWEKAARGGLVGKRYPWGDDLETGKANDNMGAALSVGCYPPNGYGLYDMAGNVFEWVWDWGTEGKGYTLASEITANPHGPDASATNTRIRRGGGYTYGSRYLKNSERLYRVPTYTAPYFGFRSATNKP